MLKHGRENIKRPVTACQNAYVAYSMLKSELEF